jgi:hypothetical protein
MERTQTAECTDVLAEHLHADLGIRTNKAKQLATALVEHAHDTVEAFSRLAEPELRDIGFADGHIKRVEEYRAQRGVGSEWRDVRVAIQWASVGPRSDPGDPISPPRRRLRIDTSCVAAGPGGNLRKVIVVSCPEKGTLDMGGSGPYDELVMEKVLQLGLKLGCERAGSSAATEEDRLKLASGDPDQIMATVWFREYRLAAKRAIILECQHFHGMLDVVCIEGGPITGIEHQAIGEIIKDAKTDAGIYGVQCRIQRSHLSYADFLYQYGAGSDTRPGQTTTAPPVLPLLPGCPLGSTGFHIFLSYRRIDAERARAVKLSLEQLGYKVFMDIADEGLAGGDFQTQLEGHLRGTPVVVALCTATVNPARDEECEFLRIKNAGDFVRLEIRNALHMQKLLIPLYTSAAPGTPAFDIGAMIWGAGLPADVADMGKQNMVDLSTNFFSASISKLHKFIEREASAGRLAALVRFDGELAVEPAPPAPSTAAPAGGQTSTAVGIPLPVAPLPIPFAPEPEPMLSGTPVPVVEMIAQPDSAAAQVPQLAIPAPSTSAVGRPTPGRALTFCFSYASEERKPPPAVVAAKDALEAVGHRVRWGPDVSEFAGDWMKDWSSWCAPLWPTFDSALDIYI